jgi:hypothetical protein
MTPTMGFMAADEVEYEYTYREDASDEMRMEAERLKDVLPVWLRVGVAPVR